MQAKRMGTNFQCNRTLAVCFLDNGEDKQDAAHLRVLPVRYEPFQSFTFIFSGYSGRS